MDRFKDYDDDVKELVVLFEKVIDNGDNKFFDVDDLEVIIDFYLDREDVDHLSLAVAYAEQLYPSSCSIRLRRAHLLCAMSQYESARKLLLELLQLEPDNCDINYALGVVYGALDQPRKAIQYYLASTRDQYELSVIYGNIADEYEKLDRTEDAIEYYRKALQYDKREQRSLNNLMLCYNKVNRLDESESFFNNLLSQDPYNIDAWVSLGMTYSYMKMYDKAIDAYEYALAIDKNCFVAYSGKAECLDAAGNVGEAASTLLESLDCAYDDDKPMVYFTIGECYYRIKNFSTAVIYYRKATELDPLFDEAFYQMTACYFELDDASSAFYYLEKALRISPMNSSYYRSAAVLSEYMNNNVDAEEYYRKALDADNSDDVIWIDYSKFLYKNERYDDAVATLLEGLPSADKPMDFYVLLCACYFKSGKMNMFNSSVATNRCEWDNWDEELIRICPECELYLALL